MHLRRPSPALAVAFTALVVALGGTATAATMIGNAQLRKNAVTSSKIRNSSVLGADIKSGTIPLRDLSKGTQNRINRGTKGGVGTSTEAVRTLGPVTVAGNSGSNVASLKLPAGAYVIQAKTTISTSVPETELLSGLADKNASAGANCRLTSAGGVDRADANVVVANRPTPTSMVMQQTATVPANASVTLDCAAAVAWTASNTSIIATKVPSVSRQESAG